MIVIEQTDRSNTNVFVHNINTKPRLELNVDLDPKEKIAIFSADMECQKKN